MLIKNLTPQPGITLEKQPVNTSEAELERRHAVKYELHEGEVHQFTMGRCYPTEVQSMLAGSLVRLLNAQIAHDGSWRCVWCEPSKNSTYDTSTGLFRNRMPTVLQCQYLDRDGDIWTAVNIEEAVHDIIDIGVHHWIQQCEEAYQFVRHLHKDVLDLREKDTYSPARGDAPTPSQDGYVPPPTAL